jgi:hypothetical protein
MVRHQTRDEIGRPAAVLTWLVDRLEIWLARSWLVATLAAGLIALWIALADAAPTIVIVPALAFLATFGISRKLDPDDRAVALGLFAWAVAARLLVVLALSLVSTEYVGGGLLSPDGAGYLNGGKALVQSGFDVGPPFTFFGTYDIGQYYVFAGVIKIFGPPFLALAVFNAAIGALAAPVVFAWARLTVPKYAVLVAGVAALSPSLALLSTTNLLKDPLVILGTLVVVWSIARALRSETDHAEFWSWLLLGALALVFLHMTRFYVAAYIELALTCALLVRLFRRRGNAHWRVHASGLAAMIVVAELAASAAGWPNSAAMLSSQVQHVMATPAMQPALEQNQEGQRGPGLVTAVDVARRALGPYVWVPPASTDTRYLVLADFDLYADTALWYLILPFLVAGLVMSLASLWRDGDESIGLGYLALFVCVYLAQYLAINLSYRQREDILLIALAFVPAGGRWMTSRPTRQALYAGYWVLLLTLAAVQILRSKG